ncbi:hypothetical protein HDU96_007663 [Phlyctochytrium bullatum]|nr:hypothetical protein HDU96_007663 [Phlyctochytrium bullatum]
MLGGIKLHTRDLVLFLFLWDVDTCTVILSDTGLPPFLGSDPDPITFTQKVFVKYHRPVSLAGLSTATAFTSAAGTALTSIQTTLPTMNGGSGNNEGGGSELAIVGGVALAVVMYLVLCLCLGRVCLVQAELTAIDSQTPDHMRSAGTMSSYALTNDVRRIASTHQGSVSSNTAYVGPP